ncbi:hypothetical protein EC396_04300 [Lutibacter sp. HS1-25]|uniref:tocopherol cyclase family protein n=1 Tax=Lutibacter sp. HS1-25 TaxID=2485000 RepID=UPI00101344F8|nr:tocopherol cyclase family protein [Lutibacter sp. HS1-25]RXP60881.1 hypothetical protein EC396_04300 [Lutibacter sp. HS1-25]
MLTKKLKALFNPERYHGWGKTEKYFEGWYYKVLNKLEDRAFAIIPGISMDENGNQQGFIQILDGKKLTAEYHKFDMQEFQTKADTFEFKLANNIFTIHNIQLDLPEIKGELRFKKLVKWPSKWYSPGIMGPFSFVPFMECYHGILSMDHSIEGQLTIHNEVIDFTAGKGYIEKDWGHSFPSAYIWMQTNHFSQPNVSLKCSVAKIPWLKSSFIGFIAGLWLNNKLIEFTTYNNSYLTKSFVDSHKVEIILENSKYKLEIKAFRHETTELSSPILGFMDGRINESMTSEVNVLLLNKRTQKIIFQDTGRNAGLEVAGKIHEIIVR